MHIYLLCLCHQWGTQAKGIPYVNKYIMHAHLKKISMSTAEDRHTVIIMDGAGWLQKILLPALMT